MTEIDIIILSYAKNEYLKNLTQQTVDTLLQSEDESIIKFNPIVIESEMSIQPYQYSGSKTLYPNEKFGYNKFMNIGITTSSSPYVCLCNNDLIFHKGWAKEILNFSNFNPSVLSFTPYCDVYHKNQNKVAMNGEPIEAYFGLMIGWCIFVKREIFEIIGLLDENLSFWYCDYDYLKTIEKHRLKNYLIPTSIVTHLGSESLKTVDKKEYKKITLLPQLYFDYKWNHKSIVKYRLKKLYFQIFKL